MSHCMCPLPAVARIPQLLSSALPRSSEFRNHKFCRTLLSQAKRLPYGSLIGAGCGVQHIRAASDKEVMFPPTENRTHGQTAQEGYSAACR